MLGGVMSRANEVIVKDPDILGGTPVFRGTRVPFQALLDYLEGGQNLDDFLDDFPTVTRDAAIASLELASRQGKQKSAAAARMLEIQR